MKTTIIGMLLSPLLLMAQQNSGAWTQIGPSPAGVIAPVVVDPRGGGSIFIGLLAGGIPKSTDSGVTWSSVNTGLTDLRIETFAMDASGPQTVYAGTFGGGIFKSINGGGTWQEMATDVGSYVSFLPATDAAETGIRSILQFSSGGLDSQPVRYPRYPQSGTGVLAWRSRLCPASLKATEGATAAPSA